MKSIFHVLHFINSLKQLQQVLNFLYLLCFYWHLFILVFWQFCYSQLQQPNVKGSFLLHLSNLYNMYNLEVWITMTIKIKVQIDYQNTLPNVKVSLLTNLIQLLIDLINITIPSLKLNHLVLLLTKHFILKNFLYSNLLLPFITFLKL